MPSNLRATNWETTDATGFQFTTQFVNGNYTNFVTIDPDGTRYTGFGGIPGPLDRDPRLGSTVPSLIEDTNGNEISVATATENGIPDVVTSWTDSMGRSIPSPAASDLTSCPTTPILPTTAWIWALAHAPNG